LPARVYGGIDITEIGSGLVIMNEEDFANLVESIKQAGENKHGSREPSRKFKFSALDSKEIRHKLEKSQ